MVVSMAAFVANDALVKVLRQDLLAGQILLVRGIFSVSLILIALVVTRQFSAFKSLKEPALSIRAVLEGLIALLFITALGSLALGDIMALLMLAPVIVTALSAFVFREAVGWRRWSAVLLAFCGMLLVVQPGSGAVPLMGAILTLLSAVGVAFRDALTKRMTASISTMAATLSATIGTTMAGAIMLASGQGWQPLSWWHIGYAALAAIVVAFGNYCIIAAHRDAELAVVAPFRYSSVVMALLVGVVAFGDRPGLISLIGVALIIASGIYTAHRERMRAIP